MSGTDDDEALAARVTQHVLERPILDGAPVPTLDTDGGDWPEWPEDLRVREVPIPRTPVR